MTKTVPLGMSIHTHPILIMIRLSMHNIIIKFIRFILVSYKLISSDGVDINFVLHSVNGFSCVSTETHEEKMREKERKKERDRERERKRERENEREKERDRERERKRERENEREKEIARLDLSPSSFLQDFDDWDDVGLNIPKPPDLLYLFRNYSTCMLSDRDKIDRIKNLVSRSISL